MAAKTLYREEWLDKAVTELRGLFDGEVPPVRVSDGRSDGYCRNQIAFDLMEFEGIATYEIVGVEEV